MKKTLLSIGIFLSVVYRAESSSMQYDIRSMTGKSAHTRISIRSEHTQALHSFMNSVADLFPKETFHQAAWSRNHSTTVWEEVWEKCTVPYKAKIILHWLQTGKPLETAEALKTITGHGAKARVSGEQKNKLYLAAEQEFFQDVYTHMGLAFPPAQWPDDITHQRDVVHAALQEFLSRKEHAAYGGWQDVGISTTGSVNDDETPPSEASPLLPKDKAEHTAAGGGCCVIL